MSKDQEIIDFGMENYLAELDKDLTFVDVGILTKDGAKGEFPLAQLATVQEFGTVIPVTEKMRGFLGATGMHLKKDTKEIVIPSRSYMRGTFDEEEAKILKQSDDLEFEILTKGRSKRSALSEIGQTHQNQIQRNMKTKGKYQANHPYTIAQKGSDNELIDTGRLRQSISFEVG